MFFWTMIAVSCPKIIIKRLSGQLIPFSVLAEPAVRASDEIIRFLSRSTGRQDFGTEYAVFCSKRSWPEADKGPETALAIGRIFAVFAP